MSRGKIHLQEKLRAIAEAKSATALMYLPLGRASLAAQNQGSTRSETLSDLIYLWRASPEWGAYTPMTKRVYGNALVRIEGKWGGVPLSVMDDPRMHARVLAWRQESSGTPAGTDNRMTVLQGLLKFGMRRRKLKINVARGIPDLYAVGQRANIIWLRQELDLLVRRADELGVPQIGDAALLAWDTGLRLQDLITVNMTHVRPSEIVKKARKRSRGRRRFAVIPRTPSLDETLERLARRPHRQGVSTLLVNPRGEPWRDFNLDIGFRELRKACGIVHIDPTTGLPQSKHLHDMRGTFATRLVTQTDLTDAEIAQIMAWAPDYVAQVRRIYVSESASAEALGRKLACATSNIKLTF